MKRRTRRQITESRLRSLEGDVNELKFILSEPPKFVKGDTIGRFIITGVEPRHHGDDKQSMKQWCWYHSLTNVDTGERLYWQTEDDLDLLEKTIES